MYKQIMISAALAVALAGGWAIADEPKTATTEAAKPAETATPAAAPAVAPAPAASTVVADGVPKDLVEKIKPLIGSAPDAIKTTPVPGVFEASFGTELLYVSADGRYVFSGDLIDAQTKTSLSETARSSGRKNLMGKLDASKTIEFKAKGDEKYVLYAFTDVDCPYCVKLHKEVPALNEKGVTVRYLAYPRAGVGSPSYKKMVNVWCADDKAAALNALKNDGKAAPDKECTNPVADDYELGQKLGVDGTPALLTADGTMIPGYRPADQLVHMLEGLATKKN